MADVRLIDANAMNVKRWFASPDNRKRMTEALDAATTIDAVEVVRCRERKYRGTPYSCPMRKLVMPFQGAGSYEDCTEDEGFCHMGVKKDGGAEK